jgi:hypothetical protein
MSSDLTGGYLTLDLNQPIKWADFRLDALLADMMLTIISFIQPGLSNLVLEYLFSVNFSIRQKQISTATVCCLIGTYLYSLVGLVD